MISLLAFIVALWVCLVLVHRYVEPLSEQEIVLCIVLCLMVYGLVRS